VDGAGRKGRTRASARGLHDPLDFYAGIDVDSARVLRSSLTWSRRRRRGDSRVSTSLAVFALTADTFFRSAPQQEVRKLFAHLCDDLVEATRPGCRRRTACDSSVIALPGGSVSCEDRGGVLDEERFEARGGAVFIRDLGIPRRCDRQTITAWRGHSGADHDFQFPRPLLK